MNNVPQKIYLQIGDECDADDFNELSTEDITWAADKIFKNDFEYVLASDKDKEIEALKNVRNVINRNLRDEMDNHQKIAVECEKLQKEIELRDKLIEKMYWKMFQHHLTVPDNWQLFKKENNL